MHVAQLVSYTLFSLHKQEIQELCTPFLLPLEDTTSNVERNEMITSKMMLYVATLS